MTMPGFSAPRGQSTLPRVAECDVSPCEGVPTVPGPSPARQPRSRLCSEHGLEEGWTQRQPADDPSLVRLGWKL